MNTQLGQHEFLAGDSYTIADIATWPRLHCWQTAYNLPIAQDEFGHVVRWYQQIAARPAVQRAVLVP